jgi:diacylglycerol kinase family enzyme
MYYYIVDPQKISQKEFERVQNILYSSLSEYRISGEVVRITGLRSVNQLVENAFSHGAKTIVAVGNDNTLTELINAVRGREDVVVGFIPLVESEIGKILGIKEDIVQAVKTIGLRRIEEIDLGSVNNNLFLTKLNLEQIMPPAHKWFGRWDIRFFRKFLNLPEITIKFTADEQYKGEFTLISGMIVNSQYHKCDNKIADPTDGKLDILLLPKLSSWTSWRFLNKIIAGCYEKIPAASILHVKKLQITSPQGLALKSGTRILSKTPAEIVILPKALKIIVGKDRLFN